MDSHFLRTSIRPIPPVERHTEYVEAGPLTVGIEYRVLADDISVDQDDVEDPQS